MTWLKALGIGGIGLSSLPESIGNLTALKELYLNDNELTSLPEIITKMTWLKALGIGGNGYPLSPRALGIFHHLKFYLCMIINYLLSPRVLKIGFQN